MVSPAGLWICNFLAMLRRWVITVLMLMHRWSAISLLVIPWTREIITSRSRSERASLLSGVWLIIFEILTLTSFCFDIRSIRRIAGTKISSSISECCPIHSSFLYRSYSTAVNWLFRCVSLGKYLIMIFFSSRRRVVICPWCFEKVSISWSPTFSWFKSFST